MFDDIVREWEQWTASARAARALARWADEQPALVGWRRLDLRWPVSSGRTDAMQAALVALAQDGDEDAMRTLIVQLSPGLTGLVWRAYNRESFGPRPFGSMKEAQREVLSSFGETVASHRLDRRPSRIAANLLLDTHQRLYRAAGREQRQDQAPPPSVMVVTPAASEPADLVDGAVDLVAAVGAALDRLTGTEPNRRLTAELAYRAWILDEPSAAIARELGLGRKTVDTRLHRLRTAVRAAHVGHPGRPSPRLPGVGSRPPGVGPRLQPAVFGSPPVRWGPAGVLGQPTTSPVAPSAGAPSQVAPGLAAASQIAPGLAAASQTVASQAVRRSDGSAPPSSPDGPSWASRQ